MEKVENFNFWMVPSLTFHLNYDKQASTMYISDLYDTNAFNHNVLKIRPGHLVLITREPKSLDRWCSLVQSKSIKPCELSDSIPI